MAIKTSHDARCVDAAKSQHEEVQKRNDACLRIREPPGRLLEDHRTRGEKIVGSSPTDMGM